MDNWQRTFFFCLPPPDLAGLADPLSALASFLGACFAQQDRAYKQAQLQEAITREAKAILQSHFIFAWQHKPKETKCTAAMSWATNRCNLWDTDAVSDKTYTHSPWLASALSTMDPTFPVQNSTALAFGKERGLRDAARGFWMVGYPYTPDFPRWLMPSTLEN